MTQFRLRNPLRPEEWAPFAILALLLFANIFVAQSSDVVATSGFVSAVGIDHVLWLWAIDNLLMIVLAAGFSLVADRFRRENLALWLFAGSAAAYVILGLLFAGNAPDWLKYSLLLLVGDQQYLLFPVLLWTLANDLFNVAQAKRLFPYLGAAAVLGNVVGNLVPGFSGSLGLSSQGILSMNAAIMLAGAVVLWLGKSKVTIKVRQSQTALAVRDVFSEGLAFVREIPAFFYLCISLVLCGVAFNTLEFYLIAVAAQTYTQPEQLQQFYGVFRGVRTFLLLILQLGLAAWLIEGLGFKKVFRPMPLAMVGGLLLALIFPGIVAAVVANALSRLALEGIDEPARRAFFGLIPDERRGRVTAFVDGYMYPLGSLISCLLVGSLVALIPQETRLEQVLYLGLAVLAGAVAFWALMRLAATYDKSMLNWRLQRRKRGSQVLDNLKL